MNIRDELLTALVHDILAPHNGRYEIIPPDDDPRQE